MKNKKHFERGRKGGREESREEQSGEEGSKLNLLIGKKMPMSNSHFWLILFQEDQFNSYYVDQFIKIFELCS